MLTIKYSDEEYEWEYIESDEENNQKAKADENKATVSLPAKVHEFPYILLFKSSVLNLVHCSSQAESLPNIADKEASIYLNRDRFARSEKDEDAASECNKRDKGSQEFIDISEVGLFHLYEHMNLSLQEDDEEVSPLPKSHAGEGKARSRKGEGRRLNRQTSTEESLSHSR